MSRSWRLVRAALIAAGLLIGGVHPAAVAAEQVPTSRAQIALSFAPVVRAAAPAVVNIYTRKEMPRAALDPSPPTRSSASSSRAGGSRSGSRRTRWARG